MTCHFPIPHRVFSFFQKLWFLWNYPQHHVGYRDCLYDAWGDASRNRRNGSSNLGRIPLIFSLFSGNYGGHFPFWAFEATTPAHTGGLRSLMFVSECQLTLDLDHQEPAEVGLTTNHIPWLVAMELLTSHYIYRPTTCPVLFCAVASQAVASIATFKPQYTCTSSSY